MDKHSLEYAFTMARRGQRTWAVSTDVAYPVEDEGIIADENANTMCRHGETTLTVYPSGLVLRVSDVNWVWWIAEERGYRQGNAVQAERYAKKKGFASPIAVNSDFLHGSQVREDRERGYVFVPSRSFPSWTQERY